MKNKVKIFLAIIVICLVSFPLFAGGQQEGDSGTDSTSEFSDWLIENTDSHITVIDSFGNKVTIKKPVKTIVGSGMGQAFSVMKAINAEDMVTAVSSYVTKKSDFFPKLSKLPVVTSSMDSINNEMLLQLSPDFILTEPTMLPLFNKAVTDEIPLLQVTFNSIESYRLFGAVLGKEKPAAEFINWIKGYTDVIDERIASLSPEEYQDVFIYYGGEYGLSDPPPYGTFGTDNHLRNELITRAGGKSISQDIAGEWISVDPEWIIEQNPPVIIRECFIVNDNPELGYGVTDDSNAEKLMNSIINEEPAFEGCDAVKNKRVHMIYGDLTEDSWFISLVYMAKWLHPGLFEDLDPVKMHQEYITRFQRLDYDVTTQGLFSYPDE